MNMYMLQILNVEIKDSTYFFFTFNIFIKVEM